MHLIRVGLSASCGGVHVAYLKLGLRGGDLDLPYVCFHFVVDLDLDFDQHQ